jgi:uncharacterized repeat protein (TIGR01451 family)
LDPTGTNLFIGFAGTPVSSVNLFAASTFAAGTPLGRSGGTSTNTFPANTGAGLAYLLSFAQGSFMAADQGAGTVTLQWEYRDVNTFYTTWPVGAKPSALAVQREARPCAVSIQSLDASGLSDSTAGSIAANPAPNAANGFYTCGTVLTLTATPANGLPFLGWSGDLTGTQNPATLKVDRSVSVNATFGQALPPAPRWTITKTHSGNFTQGQNGAFYRIAVSNSGTSPSTPGTVVQVGDLLPVGLTAVSMQGSGWTCAVTPAIGCNRVDSLLAGGSYPLITLTVNVAANAPGSVTNYADVEGGGARAFDFSYDPTTIAANATPAAWTITKTHSGNFKQGQSGAVYTITASNTGGGPTTAGVLAYVFDTLPSELTAVSLQGSGWICGISSLPIGCNRGDSLAAGASYPRSPSTWRQTRAPA